MYIHKLIKIVSPHEIPLKCWESSLKFNVWCHYTVGVKRLGANIWKAWLDAAIQDQYLEKNTEWITDWGKDCIESTKQ